MPLTDQQKRVRNAEYQRRFREKRELEARTHPDVIQQELQRELERAERGKLSAAECWTLADRLADLAMQHQYRAQALGKLAQRVRPLGYTPPGFPR
jgi:hypothetical protein